MRINPESPKAPQIGNSGMQTLVFQLAARFTEAFIRMLLGGGEARVVLETPKICGEAL